MSQFTSGEFTVDQIGFIQIADVEVLAAVARGEIDLNQIAREELASRGMSDQGRWVGFDAAKKFSKGLDLFANANYDLIIVNRNRRFLLQENTMNTQLQAFAVATNNELFDVDYNGGEWMIEAVETHETIDQFVQSSNGYNECTREKFGEIAGFKFVAFSQVQPRKGDQRRQLSVIDFGDVRYALNCDLTDFT
jgi:hypothetical protein